MRELIISDGFREALEKLDGHHQEVVLKRIDKIRLMPELGKPLHAPLTNHFSERVEKYRIIYTFNPEQVIFVYLDHRGKVYGKI